MVELVLFADTSQDGDGGGYVGFVDLDLLESAHEGLILFDILAVLAESSRTDDTKLASCERWLEEVAHVHASGAIWCGGKRGAAVSIIVPEGLKRLP